MSQDLAFHNMDFLAHIKENAEKLNLDIGEVDTRGRRNRNTRDSSPLSRQRSGSSSPIHGGYFEQGEYTNPPAWGQSEKRIASRPGTAPAASENICEPRRSRWRHGPARAASSLEARDTSVSDKAIPHLVKDFRKEEGEYDGLAPECIRRLLLQTGVFDGVKNRSAPRPGNNQGLEGRPTERDSPWHQETEAPLRGRHSYANKATETSLFGTGQGSGLDLCHDRLAAEKDHSASKKTKSERSDGCAKAYFEPLQQKDCCLITTQPAGNNVGGETLVDRTKIALMAHIPVYCHQQCQTNTPKLMPQKSVHIEAGTQTNLCSAQPCEWLQELPSPEQQYGSTKELSFAGEVQEDGDDPARILNNPDLVIPGEYFPNGDEEVSFRHEDEHPQGYSVHDEMLSDMPSPRFVGYGRPVQPVSFSHRQAIQRSGDHDMAALDFVDAEGSDIFDEGITPHSWNYEAYLPVGRRDDFKTLNDGAVPLCHHVDQATRTCHPSHVPYRSGPSQLARDSGIAAHPKRQVLRTLAREPLVYPGEIHHPFDQAVTPPQPVANSSVQHLPICGRNMDEYTQYGNQINWRGAPNLLAQQQKQEEEQNIHSDLEQERFEAYWRNRQLGFGHKFGY